jgi:uncharacterized protein (DUF1330 family)
MSAFLIVYGTPKDPAALSEYSAAAAPTLTAHGAELVVKGAPKAFAGQAPALVVIFRFPDREAIERWYGSPEYQRIIPLRDRGLESTILAC